MSDGRTAEPGSALLRLARRAVTQPIAEPVANDDARLLATKGAARMAFRVAKRAVEVAASGQAGLEVQRIEPQWKRAIWFHAEAPQIGDALLDLAPRSLFAERGIAVDLVLPEVLAGVFRGDRWCRQVAAAGSDDARRLAAQAHDFAVVDSRSWRALAGKRRLTPSLPWVSVRGDYGAYDFQRGQLAARRFAALLGIALDGDAERRHARQKLDVAGADDEAHAAGPASADANAAGRIAITLGGVRSERTYRGWPLVARALAERGLRRFTLLGSGNGSDAAREVREMLQPGGADVLDLVARTDIPGTQRAMAAARAVICVDGGLMHLACTTATPTLALFDATSLPVWRVPIDFAGMCLVSKTADVNGLEPARVVDAALELLARDA